MSRFLGEFEHVVLIALARRGGEAYGATVFEEILERTGRETSVPAVYVTLGRLAEKGYVDVRRSEGRTERGGRARKLFRLTTAGAGALRDARRMLDRLWQGVELEAI